jgi:hypothetical protein
VSSRSSPRAERYPERHVGTFGRARSKGRTSVFPRPDGAGPTFDERHRQRFGVDPEFVEADRIREETRCVRRYERSFMRPLFAGADPTARG